ncbi:MAG: BrnT family toxin [Proteobacteria bacterium]|nr:BrnT family toxin [Pseudomonadota bacterium]
MEIEFDPAKERLNRKKHADVGFEEAATCLLGMSHVGRLLVVVYSLRGDTIRLISARKPTKREENSYA